MKRQNRNQREEGSMVQTLFSLLPACRRCWTPLLYLLGTAIPIQLPFLQGLFELQQLLQIPQDNFIPTPRQAQEKHPCPRRLATWRDQPQGRRILYPTWVRDKTNRKTSAETSHSLSSLTTAPCPGAIHSALHGIQSIHYSIIHFSRKTTGSPPLLHQDSLLFLIQASSWVIVVTVLPLGPAKDRISLQLSKWSGTEKIQKKRRRNENKILFGTSQS